MLKATSTPVKLANGFLGAELVILFVGDEAGSTLGSTKH
jgi:hypothetical protein